MHSLRSRLWLLWLLTLLASAGVAALLVGLTETSSTAQLQRAEAVVARACLLVGKRFAFYATGATDAASPGADLVPVVIAALAHQPGVEGGIWSARASSLAYAYPTYKGSGPKTDLPAAKLPAIRAATAEAATGEQTVLRRIASRREGLVLAACPLPGTSGSVTAWTMARVQPAGGSGSLRAGLALLGALVLLIAGGVTWLTTSWGRHVRRIEAALLTHDVEDLPRLPATCERELDRVVAALKTAGERMAAGWARAAELAGRMAAAGQACARRRAAAARAEASGRPRGGCSGARAALTQKAFAQGKGRAPPGPAKAGRPSLREWVSRGPGLWRVRAEPSLPSCRVAALARALPPIQETQCPVGSLSTTCAGSWRWPLRPKSGRWRPAG